MFAIRSFKSAEDVGTVLPGWFTTEADADAYASGLVTHFGAESAEVWETPSLDAPPSDWTLTGWFALPRD